MQLKFSVQCWPLCSGLNGLRQNYISQYHAGTHAVSTAWFRCIVIMKLVIIMQLTKPGDQNKSRDITIQSAE